MIFFEALVAAVHKAGLPTGVFTSRDQWLSIMGGTFSGASDLPLWYLRCVQLPTLTPEPSIAYTVDLCEPSTIYSRAGS